MTSKVKGTEGIEFPDSTVQSSAALPSAEQPIFRAYANIDQPITDSTFTKVNLAGESFDTLNNFDNTLSRFVAPVNGYYSFSAALFAKGSPIANVSMQLRLNGASVSASAITPASTNETILNIADVIKLNVGDYVELFGFVSATGGQAFGSVLSRFAGFLVRKF